MTQHLRPDPRGAACQDVVAPRSSGRLPDTRTAALCGLCVLLLAALTSAERFGLVDALDAWAGRLLAPLRTPAVIEAFLALTSMGSDGALAAMVLVATVLLSALARTARLRPLWLAFLGTEASTYALKYIVARVRPETLEGVGRALTPSFPSAHSAGTAAVVGMLGLIVAAEHGSATRRSAILATAAAVALLIGFSRLLLSLHYLSDVLGGYLIALFWLQIAARELNASPA